MQPTKSSSWGLDQDECRLKLVDQEIHENNISHETEGFSKDLLVVRRGKSFKLTLMFEGRSWIPTSEVLVLEVSLGDMSEKFLVHYDQLGDPERWSAKVNRSEMNSITCSVFVCSPVLSSVALYDLKLHIESNWDRRSYKIASFILICNPWLKEDPVYMPDEAQIQEYLRSDYGLLYMGTPSNIRTRPWSFGQYEPGVLESCLKLLQVSPNHHHDQNQDYSLRANPVYLSRVVCAMVNSNDDRGILTGRWMRGYEDGVPPTDWSCSADIINLWASSNCKAVRYGQCWVFASVLCTVMRVLGIPSRVVTVYNAAHDADRSLKIEEFYSSRGEKLQISNDSIWNFHVWAECWMKRPDLGSGFDGWQVVDPTPQEKSGGIYRCGPCPVVAVQQRCLGASYDAAFICASVDADIVRMIVRHNRVVERKEDSGTVGKLIYTKSMDSDMPENLTTMYKQDRRMHQGRRREPTESLVVSVVIEETPSVGSSIKVCVTVTERSHRPRVLKEHINAQLKEFNCLPQQSFWKEKKSVNIQPGEVLKLKHTISPSEYAEFLSADDMVNLAVVIEDTGTKERFLATEEFNISSPPIQMEVRGGNSIQVSQKHTVHVYFINTYDQTLHGAVLTVEGSGLLKDKHTARLDSLQPGEQIEMEVSIKASSPGTRVLTATFSHSLCPGVVSRNFHRVSVMRDGH